MAKKEDAEEEGEEAQAEHSAAAPRDEREQAACTPVPVRRDKFNKAAIIPCGCTIKHVSAAMKEFFDFLGIINTQLHSRGLRRFESMLMPANFSSMVGEFMTTTIPKHCGTLAKNLYHNGYPDMLPKGAYPGDSLQHGTEGIEVKSSRYDRGWQGHNAEQCWLMVFVFDSNRPADPGKKIEPRPFRFKAVYLGQLPKDDWTFAGRSGTSRRTPTASVNKTGYEKMRRNWIYYDESVAAEDGSHEASKETGESE